MTENSYFWPINHYIIVMSSYRPNELCSGNTVIPMIERFPSMVVEWEFSYCLQ